MLVGELDTVVIDINCGSTPSASSLELTELVGKFVGEPWWGFSGIGDPGVSSVATINGLNCSRGGINFPGVWHDIAGAGA